MWVSRLSSSPRTAAIPPWAQLVELSVASFLVTTSTEPCSAARRAKYRPAMPEPMTR